MKKFNYPSIAVISLNAAESVMRTLASTGENGVETANVVQHSYTADSAYRIWRSDYSGRE